MALLVPDQRPPGLDDDFLPALGQVPDFPGPFRRGQHPLMQFLEYARVGLEDFADAPAEDFLAVPAVNIFRALVPEQDFSVEAAGHDGVARLVQESGLFRKKSRGCNFTS